MTPREQRVYNETRLRNLKRSLSKVLRHADLKDEAQKLQREIITLENQLQ